MIQAQYKKGNILVWIGFIGALVFSILEWLNQPGAMLFILMRWVFVGMIIWGCSLALRSKNRSLWWLLLLLPMLAGVVGIVMVVVVFALRDKTPEAV
jgi:hypothetical protein